MGLIQRFVAAGLSLAVLATGAPAADSDDPVVAGDLGETFDATVLEKGGPSFWGAVLVAKGGKIVLAKGYGAADFGKTPNTPRTLFELASASKQVTATAVLHLVQNEKLALDDTLDRVFKKVPEQAKGITVHHLLTHTSSISGNTGVAYGSRIKRKKYVEQMLAAPQLNAEPGEKFEYCNAGYALLAAIVEQVSGKSFEDYCEKHLFKPAGMRDTGFIGDKDLKKTGRASKRVTDESGDWTAADWHWGWGYRGMGGTVTTILDMHRWDRALRDDTVLDEATKKLLYTPYKEGYACGWRVSTTARGTTRVDHSGSVRGYGANVIRYLEDDAEVYVLSNDPRAAYEVSTALDKLLFPPVWIGVHIDTRSVKVGPKLRVQLDDLKWAAKTKKSQVLIQLRRKKKVVVELRAPAGYARGVLASLRKAIDALTGAGAEAAGEARNVVWLNLQPWDPPQPIDLDEHTGIGVRPADGKISVYVEWNERQMFWPVTSTMNVAAARELEAALATAIE